MYAARHALFVGPGKLPDELRHVLLKRAGEPQPDLAIQVPRLLAIFDSAADVERIASQLQRLRLGVAVAGPEQPPAELSWTVATSLELTAQPWRAHVRGGEPVTFSPHDITALTLLDWRPEEGAPDRALLVSVRDARPIMLRASALDSVSRHSVPLEGMRAINDFLDAAAAVLTPEVKVRTRRLAEADFRGDGALEGDLLPLVLAVVDAVDTLPGELPTPLRGRPAPPPPRPVHQSGLAATSAWVLYLVSLPSLVLSLGYFTIAALSLGVLATIIGLLLGAWGTRRFMWSRWLAQANWGDASPIPSWPIHPSEPGITPRPLELVLDAMTLFFVCCGVLFGEGLLRQLSLWSLPFILLAVLTSAAAVYEAWQREP
ncbi:MAG: hypothetical protein ACOZQL_26030 [Myxococcota bacterium]